jgi:hypothetical protein
MVNKNSIEYMYGEECFKVVRLELKIADLKSEVRRYADEGIGLCFGTGCDERIASRFEKILKLLSDEK